MVRLFIPVILISLGVMSDIYIFHRYINFTSMWRWLWWVPTVAVFGFIFYFILFGKGMSQEYNSVNIFLLLVGIFCIPKFVFAVLSTIPKIGVWSGLAGALGIVGIILWGITVGFTQLRVRRIVYESPVVPKALDGYRIVQFSDAHVGTFRGPYARLLKESVDTINALHPDLVCFVGDIENFEPAELEAHKEAFASLRARDGVYSIMGNHDYSSYVNVSASERWKMVERTRQLQRYFGWRLLDNSHIVIGGKRSGTDGTSGNTDSIDAPSSIVVIGEENWGNPPFPQYGNLRQAVSGLTLRDKRVVSGDGTPVFTVMLSHDPTAWKAHILPFLHPDITLSGHTHGTQFSLFGWCPASMIYKEWGGEYYDSTGIAEKEKSQKRMLNVSTGFGGNFPFRFNMPREVVLITLKHKR